jgi:hypothetical protein
MKGIFVRGRRLALVAVAVFAVAGGVAYATSLDAGQVFTACKLRNVGTIRLIDPSAGSSLLSHCTALETQVTWNEKGEPGAPGRDGAAGAPGPKGDKGDPAPTDAIGSANVQDGSLSSADLAAGAVTTSKQTAHYTTVLGGGSTNGGIGQVSLTFAVDDTAAHVVLVEGSLTVGCGCVEKELRWSLLEDGVQVQTSSQFPAGGSATIDVHHVARVAPGAHTYEVRVQAAGDAAIVSAVAPSFFAVDLGRAS